MSAICPRSHKNLTDEELGSASLAGQHQCPHCRRKFIIYPDSLSRLIIISIIIYGSLVTGLHMLIVENGNPVFNVFQNVNSVFYRLFFELRL